MAMTRRPASAVKADDGGPSVPGYARGTKALKTIKPKKKGQKPIKFHPGGLHASTGTPKGQKIPAEKVQSALSGGLGPKAKKQAQFMKDVLNKGE